MPLPWLTPKRKVNLKTKAEKGKPPARVEVPKRTRTHLVRSLPKATAVTLERNVSSLMRPRLTPRRRQLLKERKAKLKGKNHKAVVGAKEKEKAESLEAKAEVVEAAVAAAEAAKEKAKEKASDEEKEKEKENPKEDPKEKEKARAERAKAKESVGAKAKVKAKEGADAGAKETMIVGAGVGVR